MATMLNGAAVMDAALLLIAANEPCPQPQTSEHLAAVEIMKLRHMLILQNKIDLVRESMAAEQHQHITDFVRGTAAEGAPIIPVSGQLRFNIDAVCEYLCSAHIPVPPRDFSAPARMIVIRSFDVNRPGAEVSELRGGVAGGSILQGVLRIGDEVEVRPGITVRSEDGRTRCRPIRTRVVSLFAEANDLPYAVPGGLIGVGTHIDPTLCRADRLVGQVLGAIGHLPPVYVEVEINYFLLRRLLGVRAEASSADETSSPSASLKVQRLAKAETLMVNIGSTCTGGKVLAVKGDMAKILLNKPTCTEIGEKIALSRRIDNHWRLIGWGKIVRGTTVEIEDTN